MVPGRSVEAEHVFEAGEDFFRDHFPGRPVVPGVLLTEMMGQAAAMCLNAESRETGRGKAMLAQIRAASFREWVKPGERVAVRAEIRSSQAGCATASCSGEVEGRRVCTADLLFTFLPLADLAPGFRDEVLESYLASRDRGKG